MEGFKVGRVGRVKRVKIVRRVRGSKSSRFKEFKVQRVRRVKIVRIVGDVGRVGGIKDLPPKVKLLGLSTGWRRASKPQEVSESLKWHVVPKGVFTFTFHRLAVPQVA